ncbi:hypothetical protein L7F22_009862 [Adiantum nelumboides]|nr:hypothetical protein [Adiantum nelumboides]
MPQTNFDMAGITNQQPFVASPGQFNSGQGTQMNPNSVPMFQSLPYDNLTLLEKPTPTKKVAKKSQERQKKAADRPRRDLKLKENDWVLLRFEKARLRKKKGKERLYPKLSMRYYGPFQITERINDVSFRLRLPDTWKIHNAFHVSLLKPFRGDVPNDGEPDEQPEVEENEEILVPEQILAHKDTKTKGTERRYVCSILVSMISNRHDCNRGVIEKGDYNVFKRGKGVPFSWGVTEVTAFQKLKDKITTGPVLILPDLQKSFEVYCDACGRSLGAVLMQEGRVIAYESRLFSKPEMTAQIYEKELLAVIHALTQWRHYLLGADFTVFTDHQSLRYFLSQKQLSEKQMRWANILSQLHFQIVHMQG